MANLTLDAQSRDVTGRKVKDLRRSGLVPVVIYGRHQEPENAQVDGPALERVLSAGGTSQLVEVNVEDLGLRHVLIREVQRHPVRHTPLHADFYAVSMTEMQRVTVPVVATGQPIGRAVDLVLVQALDHLEIEALPADIPAHLEVDVTRLESPESDPITVGEVAVPSGVTIVTPADETLFSLIMTRAAVEEEEEEETVSLEAEPELIRREREDEEEEA